MMSLEHRKVKREEMKSRDVTIQGDIISRDPALNPVGKRDKIHSTLGDPKALRRINRNDNHRNVMLRTPELL